MFQKATRLKIRFATVKGLISTEDLWDLPLTSRTTGNSLDDVAKSLNRELKASEEESFVVETTTTNALVQLKFDIVKYIIKIRLEEREAAKDIAVAKEKKQQILAIIADKESEELKGSSLDDLKKMLDEL